MTHLHYPLQSLREGTWFKLICGASFQHLPAIRNLTLAFALAGADCVDVAADPAVIAAAKEGLRVAASLLPLANQWGVGSGQLPWLMVSLNDGEDPHFRKAEFDPTCCPSDCSRPCESVCPAQAIAFTPSFSGVIDERCYGCGRCLPICPIDQIVARSYVSSPVAIAPLVLQGVDAVEIHTQVGREADFARLWRAIAPQLHHLKLVAISCGDDDDLLAYLRFIYKKIAPLPVPVVWQTDGRPMSGDIGDGATRACIRLGQKVLAAGLPGYVQLAGGTNRHTVPKLEALGLLNPKRNKLSNPVVDDLQNCATPGFDVRRSQSVSSGESPSATHRASDVYPLETSQPLISGIAYGSYARSLLAPVLAALEQVKGHTQHELAFAQSSPLTRLEESPDLLQQAVLLADSLVAPLKPRRHRTSIPAPRPAADVFP